MSVLRPRGLSGHAGRVAIAGVLGLVVLGGSPAIEGAEAVAAPGNDMFANSQTIASWNGSVTGTTVSATRESGEPVSGSSLEELGDGPSVWYSWTAPADGLMKFDTYTNDRWYLPPVAVYTGNSVSTLSGVAFDWCNTNSAWADVSCSYVNVTAGTTYRIQVATSMGSSYPFTLEWTHVTPPSNDNFASATVLRGPTPKLLNSKRGLGTCNQPSRRAAAQLGVGFPLALCVVPLDCALLRFGDDLRRGRQRDIARRLLGKRRARGVYGVTTLDPAASRFRRR